MVGKTQSFLGGWGERHHPLANRGRKPFINSEAEQRGSFRGVNLALKPYRPLSSRPVRRRLNTVHSDRPLPTPGGCTLLCWQGSHKFSTSKRARQGCGEKKRRIWMNMWKCLRGLWRKDRTDSHGLQNCLENGKRYENRMKRKQPWKKSRRWNRRSDQEASVTYYSARHLTAICNVSPCLLSDDKGGNHTEIISIKWASL